MYRYPVPSLVPMSYLNRTRCFQAAAALKVSGDRSRITDDKLWNRDTGFRQERQKRGSAGAVIGQSTNPTQPTVFRFDTRRESKISMPSAGTVKKKKKLIYNIISII